MGNPSRLIAALSALATDAAARPLPPASLTDAALRGDLNAVRTFLNGGAAIEERTIGFASPLAAAAGRGHLDVVEFLVAHGAHLDPEGAGLPLLAFPIANRRLDVVEFLLKAGAPIAPYRSHFRLTVANGHWDMVDAMLAGGADAGWLSDDERKQLDAFVAREQPRSPEYRQRLRDAQLRQVERARVGPVARPLDEAERARHEAAAIAEVERDPSLARATSHNGTPVLALAVSCGARELVLRLLANGADPNAAGTGETPLARAAARSDVVLVEALLNAGGDPNHSGPGSPHPVLTGARAGSLACVELLLARGAKPKARDLNLAVEQAAGPDEAALVRRLKTLQTPAAGRARTKPSRSSESARVTHQIIEEPDAAAQVTDLGDSLEGRGFAATGVFETLTQTEIRMSVEIRGGTFKSSITKKTQVVVAGAKAGSKLDVARAQGLRILTEAQFRALCERIPITEEMKRRFLG